MSKKKIITDPELVNLKHNNYIPEDDDEETFIKEWNEGVPVNVDIDLGLATVLSVRMLKRTHTEMVSAAKELDMAPAKFARIAIEEKIASTNSSSAALLAQVLSRLVHKIEELEKNTG